MSFHDILPVLANNLESWRFAQLCMVDRTTWTFLRDSWKEPMTTWPFWVLDCNPNFLDLGVVEYRRHQVKNATDLLVHPDMHPMAIERIEITSSELCEIKFFFWQFPITIQVKETIRLEFDSPMYSTEKIGNVLCTISPVDGITSDVILRVYAKDDPDAMLFIRLKEELLTQILLGPNYLPFWSPASKRNKAIWGRSSDFPHKTI